MDNAKPLPTKSGEEKTEPRVLLMNLEDPTGSKAEGFTARTWLDVVEGNKLRITAPSLEAKTDKQVIASILQIVRNQVQQHGTYGELRFNGEGSPRYVYHGKDAIPLNIGDVLVGLSDLQREMGTKIADKISFLACNTFTELSAQDVGVLRARSKDLQTEIVGTTDYIAKSAVPGIENIKLISFFNGEVGKYTPSTVSIGTELLLKTRALISDDAHYSNQWTQCHQGKTQAEGVACQQKFEVKDAFHGESPAKPTPVIPNTGSQEQKKR